MKKKHGKSLTKKRSLKSRKKKIPVRQGGCDGCTECCTVLGVKALGKSQFTPCDHCINQACAIYQSRPQECQTYKCLWLVGEGEPEDRPDKLGVILEITQLNLVKVQAPAVIVREVRPDAFETSAARSFIGKMAEKCQGLIYLVRPGNIRSAFFPPWARKYAPLMQEKLNKLRG